MLLLETLMIQGNLKVSLLCSCCGFLNHQKKNRRVAILMGGGSSAYRGELGLVLFNSYWEHLFFNLHSSL